MKTKIEICLGSLAVTLLILAQGCAKAVPCGVPSYANNPNFVGAHTADMIVPPGELPERTPPSMRTSCEDAREQLRTALVNRVNSRTIYGTNMPLLQAEQCQTGVLASGAVPEVSSDVKDRKRAVEEADLVQTDENHLYLMRANSIEIVSAKPAQVVASIPIKGVGLKVLLDTFNHRLIAFSGESGDLEQFITVVSFDVTDPAHPVRVSEREYPGDLADVRLVKNELVFVLSGSLAYPAGVQSAPYTLPQEQREAILERNRELIESAAILTDQECSGDGLPGRGWYSSLPTRVVAADSDLKEVSERLLLGDASARAFSEKTAYLAQEAAGFTSIYAYGLGTAQVHLQAGAEVEGWVLNQFAMDEWKGHLRVAFQDWRRGSFVATFREQDGRLELAGMTPALAPGEVLKSVRFEGDRGYVVTFLQVDPLFTLDLSNPEQPRVLGSLKIPGYSSYIQSLSESRLLGVGREGDALQVSLFDVADPENASALAMHRFPGEGSEAEWEHLAFHVSPDGNQLALPVYGACGLGTCSGESGVRFFQLNSSAGLTPLAYYSVGNELTRRVVFLGGLAYLVNMQSLHVVRVEGESVRTERILPLPRVAESHTL